MTLEMTNPHCFTYKMGNLGSKQLPRLLVLCGCIISEIF
jgi:hypothetical protein